MAQLNSQRDSLSCEWNFTVDGDPSVKGVGGLDMGLTINPGYFVENAYYNILTPLVTTGNPAVDTVRIFFWLDFLGVTLVLADTIDNINLKLLNTWYSGTKAALNATPDTVVVQNPFAIATPGIYQIFIASTAPLTAGRIATSWSVVGLDIK